MTEQNTSVTPELQQKANAGDAKKQLELALCYAKGTDVEQNAELALDWHKKAAEQGHVEAQFALGLYYFLGIDNKQTEKLINMWVWNQAKAEGDDHMLDLAVTNAIAGWEIGGNHTNANAKLAYIYFKKAAKQNLAKATFWLGQCYLNGWGIEKNDEFAFECFKKSTEQEFEEAYYELAHCYQKGKGIEKNDELAFEWYTKAAEGNIREAQYWLACCYFEGKYVSQNDEIGFSWMRKSANSDNAGYAKAIVYLAKCYEQGIGTEKNDEKAYKCYERAATLKGNAKSQYWLAQYYFQGGILNQLVGTDRHILATESNREYWRNIFLEKGYERAFSWAEQAVDNGCTDAYLLLGFMYTYGMGIEQDDKHAFQYFKTATKYNQDGIADYFLAILYSQHKGVEPNNELATSHDKKSNPEKVKVFYGIDSLLNNASGVLKTNLLNLGITLDVALEKFNSARGKVNKHDKLDSNEKRFKLESIETAELFAHKNQEIEEKNRQLQQLQKELEDMMSMFAHKFRSPLDTIIYNTTHENQLKIYTEAAQTMRGLLDVFSIISTDSEILKKKMQQDHHGNGRLSAVFLHTLDMIILHLLSASSVEKIQQHYLSYAKAHGLCEPELSYKTWYDDFYKLEQQLQAEWETSYAQLITQSTELQPRLMWLEEHFFKLELIGFDNIQLQFKEYGVIESFLTILLNEILVNAFKYYSSSSKQPVTLEWIERDGFQVLTCHNPSAKNERTIIKGSHKGHSFLSALARKTGGQFIKPILQDDFVIEFGIPNELLLSI